MKVCHIVPSLEEQHGGPSKSVRALAAAAAATGDQAELLSTAETAPAEGWSRTEGNLPVRVFQRDWPQAICRSAGLAQALRALDADVIHHHGLWLRTLHYAHGAARRSGAKLVVSPRGMMSAWAWNHHGLRKQAARRFVHPGALEAVAGWHATSPEEETEIRALGFRQPVCIAPNGVAAAAAADRAVAKAHWQDACPATRDRPVALFYSRFHRKKRVLELIDLWLERGPKDWLLLLVGIPEDYTAATLGDYVHRQSGTGRVAVFSGQGRPPPYAVASLFLLPSHSENFGLVIAEAMANAVPALVTDGTPWRELNTTGLGWCVPWPDYPAALAAATAESASALAARGAAASAWVLREYSWHGAAKRLSAFYPQLQTGDR
jgi:glycosyltransferase involved in cell wall biosynthesis